MQWLFSPLTFYVKKKCYCFLEMQLGTCWVNGYNSENSHFGCASKKFESHGGIMKKTKLNHAQLKFIKNYTVKFKTYNGPLCILWKALKGLVRLKKKKRKWIVAWQSSVKYWKTIIWMSFWIHQQRRLFKMVHTHNGIHIWQLGNFDKPTTPHIVQAVLSYK